jgi:hypothetical protein
VSTTRFTINKSASSGPYWFRIVASNGQTLASSEQYASKQSARDAISLIKANVASPPSKTTPNLTRDSTRGGTIGPMDDRSRADALPNVQVTLLISWLDEWVVPANVDLRPDTLLSSLGIDSLDAMRIEGLLRREAATFNLDPDKLGPGRELPFMGLRELLHEPITIQECCDRLSTLYGKNAS